MCWHPVPPVTAWYYVFCVPLFYSVSVDQTIVRSVWGCKCGKSSWTCIVAAMHWQMGGTEAVFTLWLSYTHDTIIVLPRKYSCVVTDVICCVTRRFCVGPVWLLKMLVTYTPLPGYHLRYSTKYKCSLFLWTKYNHSKSNHAVQCLLTLSPPPFSSPLHSCLPPSLITVIWQI